MSSRVEGLVLRVTGQEVWVDVEGRTVPCQLRGRLRKRGRSFQIVAGDRVEVTVPAQPTAQGAVEEVLERKSWLSRFAGGRDAVERVVVANIDVILLIVSAREPRPSLQFIDRVLVSAERGNAAVRICLNKIDLLEPGGDVGMPADMYSAIGYAVHRVSVKTGEGIDTIRGWIGGGVYAFLGQSGVGKSSILNAIDPTLRLKVGDVARKTGRGRHTTSYSQLFPMGRGYIADTPGMQTFGFPGTEKEELSNCFPEFRPYQAACRFQPCTHTHEPECAVKAALEAGEIARSRFENYQTMLSEVEERDRNRY